MSKKYEHLSNVLKRLLFENNMRVSDLARNIDMHAPTLHRIVNGKSTRPYMSSLETIAKYFNINVAQLLGNENSPDEVLNKAHSLAKSSLTKVVKFVDWQELKPLDHVNSSEPELLVHNISNNGFALEMPDYSMEPVFQKGSILIFDPELPILDRNYVLVKLHNLDNYLLRQILIDGKNKFIKALNPEISSSSMHLLTQNDIVVARLIESRNKLL